MHHKRRFILLTFVTVVFVLATLASSANAKRKNKSTCSKKRLCKYGGRCDSTGTCRCNFDCSSTAWQQTVYCRPKRKDGQARQYFMNLCELLAHACEKQRDIPIVRYNYDTQRCEDEITPPTKLCKDPMDFMGPCGATISMDGSVGAGICLRETTSGMRRCECPITRTGHDCQAKKLVPRSVHGVEHEANYDDELPSQFPTHFIVYGVLCFLILISVVFIIFNRYSSHRTRNRDFPDGIAMIPPTTEDCFVQVDSDKHYLTSKSTVQSLRMMERFSSNSEDTSPSKPVSVIPHHPETP